MSDTIEIKQINHKCPKCNSEIIALNKSFSVFGFICVLVLSVITLPLLGLGILIFLIYIAGLINKKPDKCPICNNHIQYDKDTNSMVFVKGFISEFQKKKQRQNELNNRPLYQHKEDEVNK